MGATRFAEEQLSDIDSLLMDGHCLVRSYHISPGAAFDGEAYWVLRFPEQLN